MTEAVAHKYSWETFEIIFGIPFLISLGINVVIPFSLAPGILRIMCIPIGIILILTGMCFIILARREFALYGQHTDPGFPTRKIVTSSVYSISRNPLYFGGILILLSIGTIFNVLWIFIALIVSIVICHYILILPEERYLTAEFGEEYQKYFKSVNRWFGRKRTMN